MKDKMQSDVEHIAKKLKISTEELGTLYIWLEELGYAGVRGAKAGTELREKCNV